MSAREIDDYLGNLEEPKRTTLQTLRQTILSIVPQAEQGIAYGCPAFRMHGKVVAGFAAFKNHLSYLPHSGSVFKQIPEEVAAFHTSSGALQFPIDRPLPKTLVKRLVDLRLEEIVKRYVLASGSPASELAERKRAMKATQKSARSATGRASRGFTDEERAAMKARVQELRAAADKVDGESEVLAKIAEMPKPDRAMAERLHAIIKASAPSLSPRTWYGMPAYAKDGKVVCHFQTAQKFKTRYATLGFSDAANLDEGTVWPVAFALTALTAADEARIGALVKKAVS